MDYPAIYCRTIARFQQRVPPTTNFHLHHIIPKAWGGTNDHENLVKVSIREHLHLHLLLARIDPAQSFAVIMLCNQLKVNSPKWVRKIINEQKKINSQRYQRSQMQRNYSLPLLREEDSKARTALGSYRPCRIGWNQ